jgi:hypothetical protein
VPSEPGQTEDWIAVARRNSRSVQTTIGWIFWDPGAVSSYEALGLPGPLGYIASRAAPLAPAGPDAVIAAFGSISPAAIRMAFDLVGDFQPFWRARDEAVVQGLDRYAPDICPALVEFGPPLWEMVGRLPTVARVLFGAHLGTPRPEHPVLSGWHAVNCLREWRGDTHWALIAAAGLSGIEASILHNAWLGYEQDWLPRSRGSSDEEIGVGWSRLEHKALARDRTVTSEGVALRQRIEDDTDALSATAWQLLGAEAANRFARSFEPPCERLLKRVDETAGPNSQPASRVR